jgi:hypothetical protein
MTTKNTNQAELLNPHQFSIPLGYKVATPLWGLLIPVGIIRVHKRDLRLRFDPILVPYEGIELRRREPGESEF